MIENFVTIFDKNFIPQGLTLYDSLVRNIERFNLWVLCIDLDTEIFLKKINKKFIKVISIKDYEDEILKKLKKERSTAEYCWTLTPIAPKIVFKQNDQIKRVTYLDADMFFVNKLDEIFYEFEDSKKSILITEHDFDEDHAYKEKISGKYIVQFIIFQRNKSEMVRKWWEAKCIEKCSSDQINTIVGDQGYLNDWQSRFKDDVHILQNNDVFRSTWSSKKLKLTKLIAWHFHGLRIINKNLVLMHTEKYISNNIISEVYRPYLKNLEKNINKMSFEINQFNIKKNLIIKILLKLNLILIEKKIIKNKRYFLFK